MLKFLVLLLSCKISDSSVWTLSLVHTLPQQSHTNLSVCPVHYVSHLVSQFGLFIHVFGQCWCHNWRQVFLSRKVWCCNGQLNPQSHELIEFCLSTCIVLEKADVSVISVVVSLKNFTFDILIKGISFGATKLPKFVLTFSNVHIIGTSKLDWWTSIVRSHGWKK